MKARNRLRSLGGCLGFQRRQNLGLHPPSPTWRKRVSSRFPRAQVFRIGTKHVILAQMTEAELREAKKFWLMFQAKETFKAVHQGCLELVRSGLSETSPLYFPLIAGLICLYGKPFKENRGVGKLPIKMVPKENLNLHTDLITIRDKLYAHSDADKTVMVGNLHFGEVRCFRWPDEGGYCVEHLHIAPEFFSKFMAVLAEQMMEKTNYHVDRLGKKFAPLVPRRSGEFLLNIKDKDGPLFKQVEPLRARKGA